MAPDRARSVRRGPNSRSFGSFVATIVLAAGAPGCSTTLDVERLTDLFRAKTALEAPTLLDEPASDLALPEGLRATSGELRAVPLQWNPVLTGRVGGYSVERALVEDDAGFSGIAVLAGRFSTSFVDRGVDLAPKAESDTGRTDLGDGAAYAYRVRAFDSLGRLSRHVSAKATATTALAPSAPESLHAYSHLPRRIALSWRAVHDSTVVGYVVYRSPSARGPFEPIAQLDGHYSTTHLDSGLGDLRVFYYRVAAVNGAGGEGEASHAARAVTKPEPLPPVHLRVAAQGLGTNRLAWDPNVERDLEGYRVLRRRADASEPEIVATVHAGTEVLEDRAVAADERVSYTVIAFDGDDLESRPAQEVDVVSEGYELRATAHLGSVQLHWTPRPDEGFVATRVYRKGRFRLTELARVPSEGFVDTDVEPGGTYHYVARMERPDGSLAPPSTPVAVTLPEAAVSGGIPEASP